MLSRLTDFERASAPFDLLEEVRRRMDRVWDDFEGQPTLRASNAAWPRANVLDLGTEIVVRADVPGLAQKDLDISLHDNVLTIAGERKIPAPEGYTAQRRERAPLRFSRSFALPVKVDPERTTAKVESGVLTVTLAKAEEVRPRKIVVR
jgi:HSP20 family protein